MQPITWDTWGNTWDSLWHSGSVFCYYNPMPQNFSRIAVSKSDSICPSGPAPLMWKYEKEMIYMFVILITNWGISCTYSLLFWKTLLILKHAILVFLVIAAIISLEKKKVKALTFLSFSGQKKRVRSLKYDSRHFFPWSEQTLEWHLISNDF